MSYHKHMTNKKPSYEQIKHDIKHYTGDKQVDHEYMSMICTFNHFISIQDKLKRSVMKRKLWFKPGSTLHNFIRMVLAFHRHRKDYINWE